MRRFMCMTALAATLGLMVACDELRPDTIVGATHIAASIGLSVDSLVMTVGDTTTVESTALNEFGSTVITVSAPGTLAPSVLLPVTAR